MYTGRRERQRGLTVGAPRNVGGVNVPPPPAAGEHPSLRHGVEPLAQACREPPGPLVTGLPGRERVAGGGPEAEDEGVGELPVLEAAGHLCPAARVPGGPGDAPAASERREGAQRA